MQRFVMTVSIAAGSFYLGWVANEYFSPVGALSDTAMLPVITGPEPVIAPRAETVTNKPPKGTRDQPAYRQRFRHLLNEQHFDAAMLVFDQAVEADEKTGQLLHSDLVAYLHKALDQQHDEAVMALVDAYLSRYYDDVDVLLVLAEYQRRQGYPEEAARVFQLALTYVYQPDRREKVLAALQQLVSKTDALFAQQQRWIELLNFYQLLASIDLSQPAFLLRQAVVYIQLDDTRSARSLLLDLTEDSQWGGEAAELLATIDQHAESAPAPAVAVNTVPLQRHGNHYLINAQLNGLSDVTLMIDTGASVTSLSRASFVEVSQRSAFTLLGSRLFNTANGIARGDVYRVDTFNLGDYFLQDIEIAVLDFHHQQAVDGLLGMNVLQHFRFEIDQDQQLLLLQGRGK